MATLTDNLTKPKPEFSEFFIQDLNDSIEIQREKYLIAYPLWKKAAREWRFSNRPTLLRYTPLPTDEPEKTPLLTPFNNVGWGRGGVYKVFLAIMAGIFLFNMLHYWIYL